MSSARILYRTRQFWHNLVAAPASEDLELAQSVLTAPQMALFTTLNRSEQTHGLRALRAVLRQGADHPALLVAALLHDVGKSRFPLQVWERVLIVLAKAVCSRCVRGWGAQKVDWRNRRLVSWKRAFIVAEQHPAWGAEMVSRAGASQLTVALIRRHQEDRSFTKDSSHSLEDHLLSRLQAVDDES